ncbi:hypothetical protein K431DRAFT_134132 [Polychaeton citri CBS 116435]|uniref:ZZ-type domain-containing protein n=1 Tax=Polychaeton citri CBS 116435 TaxID=1314669 RepID=A0A9P4QCR2_9PEZI|nr:hypothetical protein K431DRAFT_134132 [Polychaeton citri CBS 116435]
MADPFSIATGIIGLAETGTALASFLTDKYRAYRDAPEQILEIAHEVEFCAGLISVFEEGIERRAGDGEKVGAGSRFERDAGNLVWRTKKLFQEIRDLIPKDTNSLSDNYIARWRYMFDKKKLSDKQQRLREMQQMFMFMETMYRYNADSRPPTPASKPTGSKDPGFSTAGAGDTSLAPGLQGGSFEGLMTAPQPQSNGDVSANSRGTIQFMATLTLKPMPQPEAVQATRMSDTISVEPRMGSLNPFSHKKKKQDKRESRLRLENLRRSPYFRPELLEPEIEVRMGASMPVSDGVPTTTYNEAIDYVPETRAGRQYTDDEEEEEEQRLRRDICSRDEASKDVEGWFDKWFKDGDNDDDKENNADDDSDSGILNPTNAPLPRSTGYDIPESAPPPPRPKYPWETNFSHPIPRSYYEEDSGDTQPGGPVPPPQHKFRRPGFDSFTVYSDDTEPDIHWHHHAPRGPPPPPQPQPRSSNTESRALSSVTAASSSSLPSTANSTSRSSQQWKRATHKTQPRLEWQCDSCHLPQVNGSRYHCTLCRPSRGQGYDLCKECYCKLQGDDDGDGEEWEHVHPKACFVEMVVANPG